MNMINTDAIIYSDGSLNFDYQKLNKLSQEEMYAAYGFLIFFKENQEVYYESGRLLDGEGERIGEGNITEHNVYAWRYGKDYDPVMGEVQPEEFWYKDVFRDKASYSEETNRRKHRFVLASGSDVGEMEGVRRALEICAGKKNIKNVVIVHDLEIAQNIYKGNYDKKKNEPVFYGEELKKIKSESGIKVKFEKVKSHESGENFVHGVGNDCADIMAKAETGNSPIGGKEVNPNLEKVWNEKMKGKIARYNIETRRKEVRDVIEQTIPMMLNMYETHNEQTGGCENGN